MLKQEDGMSKQYIIIIYYILLKHGNGSPIYPLTTIVNPIEPFAICLTTFVNDTFFYVRITVDMCVQLTIMHSANFELINSLAWIQ